MTLCIDIGNTSAKAAIFNDNKIVEIITNYELRITKSPDYVKNYDNIIYCSTRGDENIPNALKPDHATPVPLKNLYATPHTLGMDRLAAAVGAHTLYPEAAVLIVDFGTAITFDVVTAEGEFLGGNISPGVAMRFRALNEFTGKLPLLSLPAGVAEAKFPADNTHDAIFNGVVDGISAEIDHYIAGTGQRFGGINILFTGGDANYFAERTKNAIFVVSDLVFYGLNAILEYNKRCER